MARRGFLPNSGVAPTQKCAFVVMLAITAVACAAAQQVVTLQGRLRSTDDHANGVTWAVQHSMTGEVWVLATGQPSDMFSGRPVPLGSTVALTCTVDPGATSRVGDHVCSAVSNVLFLGANAPMQSINVAMNWLVLLVNVNRGSCTNTTVVPNVSVQQVNTLIFKARDGYASYWSNCSFGKYRINAATTRILSVNINCSTPTMVSKCEWATIGRLADEQAKARLGALYSTTYDDGTLGRRTYILPKGMISSCGFGGLAWMPGTQTWLLSDPWNGINDKRAPFHENLHNLGLGHATYNGNEYGDFTSPLGSGNGCPNAPEMRRLNWTTATANLEAVNMITNRWLRYTINSQSIVAASTYIRIRPTWMANYTSNVYVSYRVRNRGDLGLGADMHQKVLVHKVTNLAVDNDASLRAWGDAWPTLLAWGGVGQDLDLKEYKMVVRITSLFNAGNSIIVNVCRYSQSVASCSFPNAAVSPPPSPPRSPPPPAPVTPPVTFTYMGCYKDNSTRAVPLQLGNASAAMTVPMCAARAQAAGLLVFAVQGGNLCFGGNSVQDAATLGFSNTCNMKCTGDNNTICGGVLSNSVYVLDGMCAGGYYGCFGDWYYDFAMTWGLDQGGDFNMTWERCQEQARLQGWPYFGLVNGNLCWFSEELQNVVKYGVQTGCNKPCSGNPAQICGGEGEYMFSLYRTDRCGALPQVKCRPGACGSFPGKPECVSVPQYQRTAWGSWSGQCESRLANFSDHRGGAPGSVSNSTAFLPPSFEGITVKPENGIASQRRPSQQGGKNAPPRSPSRPPTAPLAPSPPPPSRRQRKPPSPQPPSPPPPKRRRRPVRNTVVPQP